MAAAAVPPRAPRVAVVTVSFGSQAVLPAFLASVDEQRDVAPLVVVADNKPDETIASLTRSHGATHFPLGENLGYGGAINAAVATLPDTVEWVLVSNPDVTLQPGSLSTMVSVGDSDELIGSVGPAILTAEGALYPSARNVPSLRTGVGHAMFGGFWPNNPWTRAYKNDTEQAARRRDAGWLSGACVLVRRTAFDELNGFDSGYFMYFEDVDLGYRLGKRGYRNVYEPAAVVTHTGAHSTSSDSDRMITAHHHSAIRFLNRKYARRSLWPVRAALTAGLRLRLAFVQRSHDK